MQVGDDAGFIWLRAWCLKTNFLKETDYNFMLISFCLHSISQKGIDTVAVNPSGEWLAFGCKNFGQLLVWEWQSETYILRQQGHYNDINTLSFSQDGHYVATGGDDGKVCMFLESLLLSILSTGPDRLGLISSLHLSFRS